MKSVAAACESEGCDFKQVHQGSDMDDGGGVDEVAYAARRHADQKGHPVSIKRKGFASESIKPRKHRGTHPAHY